MSLILYLFILSPHSIKRKASTMANLQITKNLLGGHEVTVRSDADGLFKPFGIHILNARQYGLYEIYGAVGEEISQENLQIIIPQAIKACGHDLNKYQCGNCHKDCSMNDTGAHFICNQCNSGCCQSCWEKDSKCFQCRGVSVLAKIGMTDIDIIIKQKKINVKYKCIRNPGKGVYVYIFIQGDSSRYKIDISSGDDGKIKIDAPKSVINSKIYVPIVDKILGNVCEFLGIKSGLKVTVYHKCDICKEIIPEDDKRYKCGTGCNYGCHNKCWSSSETCGYCKGSLVCTSSDDILDQVLAQYPDADPIVNDTSTPIVV